MKASEFAALRAIASENMQWRKTGRDAPRRTNQLIRIADGRVQSSNGYSVTIAEAIRLWNAIRSVPEGVTIFHGVKIDGLSPPAIVDGEDRCKAVYIGCTKFKLSEIKRAARKLNLNQGL